MNKTSVGKKLNASDIVSEIILVRTTKTRSLIPSRVILILKIRTKLISAPNTLHN